MACIRADVCKGRASFHAFFRSLRHRKGREKTEERCAQEAGMANRPETV